MADQPDDKAAPNKDREARLAAALRANLKRRKAPPAPAKPKDDAPQG